MYTFMEEGVAEDERKGIDRLASWGRNFYPVEALSQGGRYEHVFLSPSHFPLPFALFLSYFGTVKKDDVAIASGRALCDSYWV